MVTMNNYPNMNIGDKFEYATRKKLRFPFKGLVSIEALWEMSLVQLDTVYKELIGRKTTLEQDGLMENDTRNLTDIVIEIDLVRYIYSVQEAEIKDQQQEAARELERKQILQLIAEKQNEAFRAMTIEELKAKLDELK